jgi:Fungalysin metallopeptidase (M36)/Fungalysin/Thermolysin Propeptide Motif
MTPGATRPILLSVALATALALLPASAGASPLDRSLDKARAEPSELNRERTVTLPGGARIVRLQQRTDGIPVLGGEAVATEPAGQPAALVTDATHGGIAAPPDPRVSEATAIDAALAHSDVGAPSPAPRATLAIEPGGGGTLVWRVVVHSERPVAAFEVLVDARDGGILRARDLLQDVSGHAKIFDPNPVVTHGKFQGLHNDHDKNSSLLTALRVPVTLHRLTVHQNCLKGKFVRATVKRKDVCRKHRQFRHITRAQDGFEAVMAYHHIDRTQAYVQSLDVGDINHTRTRVRVDAFPDDNSFFDPIDGQIRYGRGGVDDAEDGDVIVHEYGHALQDAQVHHFGDGNQAGALSEGWGDYIAAMMSSQSPGTDEEDDVCIFEWDSTSYDPFGTCDRRADDPRTLAQAQPRGECNFEIHCVGQVWSSALWKLRTQLGDDAAGRSVMDRVALTSNFLLVRGATFQMGGQALLDADALLYPVSPGHGAHEAAIRAELVARGLLPA